MKNVSVLGCGRWGTFLGWYASKLDKNVLIWGRKNSSNLNKLQKDRKNEYLSLKDTVVLSNDLQEAIDFGNYLIISVSSQNLRELAKKINQYNLNGKIIILAMKGIENNTGKRLTQVVLEEIRQNIQLAIWVGPGHVQSFVNGVPNCMLISSTDVDTTKCIIEDFNSELVRLYIGQDLIGNEVGAAAKNVIGIAAGMLDGLDYASLKGALMARGSREISRLVRAMGGNELTVYGLSHVGDYEATLFSDYSHNKNFGEAYVKNGSFEKLAEGVSTVKSMMVLAEKYNEELPICESINTIIHKKEDAKQVLKNLFMRSTKFEF
ncbi:MAG: glycerol-3-phosphate dehydrogenase [Marinilabiliales bacterium]|nr:MAG: glycerol-3-phosphate dehydrogenase [Marinilabiliales bacterium]